MGDPGTAGWGEGWHRTVTGDAAGLVVHGGGMRFINLAGNGQDYANAQLDTYAGLPRGRFTMGPPLRFTVQARFSHPVHLMQGTAGFGFWNDPFMMSSTRRPALPAALWFFLAGAKSEMELAYGVPGNGWKAATVDARRPLFYALIPTAPVAMLLMRNRTLYRRLWPLAQRAMGVHEALLEVDITQWHHYALVWTRTSVRFVVDGEVVLTTTQAPRGPLGCVIWLDNQYLVVRPDGGFDHGICVRSEAQWMEVAEVAIHRQDGSKNASNPRSLGRSPTLYAARGPRRP